MKEKLDCHIQVDKELTNEAKELTGLTHKEIYEYGCKALIMRNRNPIDFEITELNTITKRLKELTPLIMKRLKHKEVPTKPNEYDNNDEEGMLRNILPLDMFKEIVLYYMDDFNITDIEDIGSKNREVFQFILINLTHYGMEFDDINELYAEINSE